MVFILVIIIVMLLFASPSYVNALRADLTELCHHAPHPFRIPGTQVFLLVPVFGEILEFRLSRILQDQFPIALPQCLGEGKKARLVRIALLIEQ